MDRRTFLKMAGVLTVSASLGGCAATTPRLVRPEPLVRPDEKLLLTNVRVIDVKKGVVSDYRSVLVQNGKIAGLFRPGESVTADRTVDLADGYMIPGLINAHTHMGLPGGLGFSSAGIVGAYMRQIERGCEECVKHGVTTTRDMLATRDLVFKLVGKIQRGEILGPRILQSCAMDCTGSYGEHNAIAPDPRFFHAISNPAQATEAVRRAADDGVDFVKLFHQIQGLLMPGGDMPVMDAKTMEAVRNEADRHGLPVALHHTEKIGLDKALQAGITDLQHIVGDQVLDDASLKKMIDNKVSLVPTASAFFGLAHKSAYDPNWGEEPLPELLNFREAHMRGLVEEFCEPEFVEPSLHLYRQLKRPENYDQRHLTPWPNPKIFTASMVVGKKNADLIREAGIEFGCGNDGGVPFVFPGALSLEMELMQKFGAEPAEILRAATVTNARLCKLDNRLGSIETGKIADLVVLYDNPLRETSHMKKPALTFMDGMLVYQRYPKADA